MPTVHEIHDTLVARFVLLPEQRHDNIAASHLIDGIDMQALLADKGSDNNRLCETETEAAIPPKAYRKDAIPCDFAMYRWRHLVENFFSDLDSSEASQRVTTR